MTRLEQRLRLIIAANSGRCLDDADDCEQLVTALLNGLVFESPGIYLEDGRVVPVPSGLVLLVLQQPDLACGILRMAGVPDEVARQWADMICDLGDEVYVYEE